MLFSEGGNMWAPKISKLSFQIVLECNPLKLQTDNDSIVDTKRLQ